MGLLQGEILSPILFSLFLNDIEMCFQENPNEGISIDQLSIYLLLFADDAVIMSETAEGLLQVLLNQLELYCCKWNLIVNVDKTKVLIFRKGRLQRNMHFTYAGTDIEIVSEFNYLGLVFSCGAAFAKATNMLSSKAVKAMNGLFANVKYIDVPVKTMFNLFDSLVAPILNYACEIWGCTRAENCERIHRKFCKWVLNVKINTNNYAIYGETGRFPLYIERHVRMIKYWFKISDVNNKNCILSTTYAKLLDAIQNDPNSSNWLSHIKSILDRSGFHEVWLYRASVNIKQFIPTLRQRLRDIFINEWREGIMLHSSLFLYREFKTTFELATYFQKVESPKLRKFLSKIRLSSHNLNIEEGRYRNEARPQRICNLCDKRDIEDEFHFIIVCPIYSNIRSKFIKKYFFQRPSMFKFIELMQSNNVNVLRKLAKYIIQAFELRNTLTNRIDIN